MNEILNIIAAVGLPILAGIIFFITRRSGSSADSFEERVNRNNNDLRRILDEDRERESEERADIKRERTRLDEERRAVSRTGSIIRNARKSISGIIKSSKKNDEG